MTGYELSRTFWDFAFDNPTLIKPNHSALYFYSIEHCNRLGWKEKFGLPTSVAMEAIGISSYSVYKRTFDELVEFGFFEVIQYSKNQFTANVIALKYNYKAPDKASTKAPDKASTKALDKAIVKHIPKQVLSTIESIESINKQVTIKPKNNKTIKPITNKDYSETSVSDGIYPACILIYDDFIKNKTGVGAKINAGTGAAMKKIIAYMKNQVKNKDDLITEVPRAIDYLFSNFDKWDSFHQSQLNLNQIESNLINIINSIKNGKRKSNNSIAADRQRDVNELAEQSREFLKTIASQINQG